MNRNLYGLSIPLVLAWCLRNPRLFGVPCTTIPRRRSIFFANAHGMTVRRGDLLALHASGADWRDDQICNAALRVREAMDTSIPTHPEPYRALAGKVVAVASLATCISRPPPLRDGGPPDPWCTTALRDLWRQTGGDWWCLLDDVRSLPVLVECAGGVGLWSLPYHVTIATMDQMRAIDARAKGAA